MKNNKDLISIILPVYNVEKYLDKCMETIINQTYKNLEIILVDDGSPDNCPHMCDEWATKDKRVKVIHKPNGGVSTARNEGLKVAKGNFIGFVDPDDFIDVTMYEELYKCIKEKDAHMAMCRFTKTTENGEIINYIETRFNDITNENIFLFYLLNYYFKKDGNIYTDNIMGSNWRVLYKRDFIGTQKFIEGVALAEDLIFNMELIKKDTKIALVDKSLYYYLIRNASALHTYNEKKINDQIILANTLHKILKNKVSTEMLNAYDFREYFNMILTVVSSNDKNLYKKVKNRIDELSLNTKEKYKDYKKYLKSKRFKLFAYLAFKKKIKTIKFLFWIKHFIKK